VTGQERERCKSGALSIVARTRLQDVLGWAGDDIARFLERERAHAAATALFVERVCIWLVRMAELGAAIAYHEEMQRLKAALAADWLANGP